MTAPPTPPVLLCAPTPKLLLPAVLQRERSELGLLCSVCAVLCWVGGAARGGWGSWGAAVAAEMGRAQELLSAPFAPSLLRSAALSASKLLSPSGAPPVGMEQTMPACDLPAGSSTELSRAAQPGGGH